MKLNEYQTEAQSFAVNDDLMHFTFGLLEEAGEAAGVLKRVYRDDVGYVDINNDCQYQMSYMARDKLILELGDILWHVALVANNLGYSLEAVADLNLQKLESRKQRDMIKGSGDDR
jgi:NTP pyrophosphatase (non-canonical NTP hydrolase)